MSSGEAACAYMPVLPKPSGMKMESKKFTELSAMFSAACFKKLLSVTMTASVMGTIETMPVSTILILSELVLFVHVVPVSCAIMSH